MWCEVARDLWSDAGREVVRGEFTQVVANTSRPPAPNLILANLPYVRHHYLERKEKERLQALAYGATGVTVSVLAGLYGGFSRCVRARAQRTDEIQTCISCGTIVSFPD